MEKEAGRWFTLVTLILGRLQQEDHEFKSGLGYPEVLETG